MPFKRPSSREESRESSRHHSSTISASVPPRAGDPIERPHSTPLGAKLKGLFKSPMQNQSSSHPERKVSPQPSPGIHAPRPQSAAASPTSGSLGQSLDDAEHKRPGLSVPGVSGSLSKLKLKMAPVIENDLDDVLEARDEEGELIRGRSSRKNVSSAEEEREREKTHSRSSSKVRSPTLFARSNSQSSHVLHPTTSAASFVKTHHDSNFVKDGNLITFADGTPHRHDFSKLQKQPIQSLSSGFLSTLIGAGASNSKKMKDDSGVSDVNLEKSVSLLPDSYSCTLIELKGKPENYRWNYDELEYSDSDSCESDGEEEDDEIDPIIGTEQCNLIKKLSYKIENFSEIKQRLLDNSEKKLTLSEKYGKLQGVIGKGSYGTVKLSMKTATSNTGTKTQRKVKQIFAIKQLQRKPDETASHFSNRVTSEFMISSSLTHQALINVYDLMVEPASETFSQIMEFIPSGDLYSLISASHGEGLQITECDCFFKQILNAVTYLHSVGITHNDLKVENLLLTPHGQLKIIDFGTSTVFKTEWEKEIQLSSGCFGSEPYIAPEQFIEHKVYDPRKCDVWSLGVIYLVMANGGYVWGKANKEDHLSRIISRAGPIMITPSRTMSGDPKY